MLTNTTETPELDSQDSDVCPVCRGTGWKRWRDADGIEWGARCDCGLVERQILERKLEFANLPAAFQCLELKTFSLDAYRSTQGRKTAAQACAAIKYYLDNLDGMKVQGMGLYLYSATKGSGKTRMAASIANELIRNRRMQVRFAGSTRIVQEIKATWKNENYSESDLLNALISAQVLVIDDFGTEMPKDWIGEKFYSIINGRYQDKLVTIFTSNMSLNDLKYDDRITSRIKERTFQIPFPEESVRDAIAEENRQKMLAGMRR
jgi:DNA replication protein DnaC